MLARSGTVRMPTIYGVMTHEEHPGPDVLLLERMRGVSVEAPARTTPELGNNRATKSPSLYWPRVIVRQVAACVGGSDNTGTSWPRRKMQHVSAGDHVSPPTHRPTYGISDPVFTAPALFGRL